MEVKRIEADGLDSKSFLTTVTRREPWNYKTIAEMYR